ncbi:MAG TPA: hypothetical protein VHE11_05920 [Steroidobacteraceae bacterium]|nr:hypothetical protein [Steroidobacteraceae bacterium]
MTRDEFVRYLAPRADAINIRLHRSGALAGLPWKFHQALAVAQLLDALGQRAPSSEDLRAWYGAATGSTEETARWIYRVVGSLRDWDLEKLDLGELMSFWVRFDTWGEAAYLLAREARARLRPAS